MSPAEKKDEKRFASNVERINRHSSGSSFNHEESTQGLIDK